MSVCRVAKRQPPRREVRAVEEAEVGFEPTNNGFAIRPLGPLGYSAKGSVCWRVTALPSNGEKFSVCDVFAYDGRHEPIHRNRR